PWQGHHSIRVNDQWRVVFRWASGSAFDVQIIDYHWSLLQNSHW
ncbi:MAG: hypothetical protein GY892_09040, partial [Shimia sp.]|nr:hypothetical protein [Shimia sp.]